MKPKNLTQLMVAAACLLPICAFADPQLVLDDSAEAGDCDSAIVDCHSYPYANNQSSPTGSLSDGNSMTDAPWGFASFSADVFFGSFHAEGSTSALETVDGNRLGDGSVSSSGSWTNAMTVNSPGMDGQPVTVRITYNASGNAGGSGSGFGGSNASYTYSISDGITGLNYGGNWNTENGWDAGGPPGRIFTFDASCTSGQPCQIYQSASFSVASSTGEPDFGDPQESSASASGSLSFHSGSIQVLDPNNDNAPVSFSMVSDVGSGAGQVTPAGGSYAGLSVTNSAPDRFGSTVQLLDGAASADTQVVATFSAPPSEPEIKPVSDVVSLQGTNTDPVVIQISYDANIATSDFGSLAYLELAWFHNSTGTWKNAILGNSGTTMPTYFNRAYNPATDFHLGYFGNDTANHVVWAVVNHNSEYVVTLPVPVLSVPSVTHPAAHTFHLNCQGEPARVNRVEASPIPSPAHFNTIASITADGSGNFQFDDTNAGNKRFYRVAYP